MHFLSALLALFLATFSHTLAVQPLMPLAPVDVSAPHATILFGGDMMFDRTIRTTAEEKGGDYLFSCIDSTLSQADLVVANLEGPITASSSKSVGSAVGAPANFVFTFPESTATLLAAHHIGVVNLGNNHEMNFGSDGVLSTRAALDAEGVLHFGDPVTQDDVEKTVNGLPLVFINYNEFGGSASSTLAHIAEAKKNGEVPVVYTHWGIEYAPTSPQYVKDLAHEFVDAGAAAVIGSHPHVVEDHETYHGVPIYYSLGNLIFDQYFSDAVDHGLMLSITFTGEGVQSIKEIPVVLNTDRTVCPVQ